MGQRMRPGDAYRLLVGKKWRTADEEDKKYLIKMVKQLIDKVVQSSRSCIFIFKWALIDCKLSCHSKNTSFFSVDLQSPRFEGAFCRRRNQTVQKVSETRLQKLELQR